MFAKFTSRAAAVVRSANLEARKLRHEYIGTEHLLLGLLHSGGGIGLSVLSSFGVDLAEVERRVGRILAAGPDLPPPGARPQTPRAKMVFEFAAEEAALTQHGGIDTGHLLVALLREDEGVAAQVLRHCLPVTDASLSAVRDRVNSERLRLADDVEPDALRRPDVGNRAALVWRAGWRAAGRAALLSVPTSLIAAAAFWFSNLPLATRVECVVHILLWTNVCWISIAASVHVVKAREDTMSPEHRRLIQRYVFWAAVQATCFSSPVVAFCIVGTWGYGPAGAVLCGLTILGIWVGCACAAGHARGSAEVRALEEREQHEVGLIDARRSLEAAIADKFGPLDERRRAAIQTWDKDRVAEARRKLDDARSVEELEA